MKIDLRIIFLLCFLILLESKVNLFHNGYLRNIQKIQESTKIPNKFFGGQIHFSRIPYQYWQHRLQMIKAMGFNVISVYIFWSHHQIQKGKFDYQNEQRNLIGFLNLARKYDLKVIFRGGPYGCGQWDYGALPVRLMAVKDLVIRSNNKLFLDQVKIYFQSLVDIISKNRDVIIMIQIQNQYGLYGNDKSYIIALKQLWADLSVDYIPFCYADPVETLDASHWDGANIGINDGKSQDQYITARQLQPKGYIFGGQIYSGWLNHWGQDWAQKSLQDYIKQFQFLMAYNHSFCMYMAHGGTNFGLHAGANSYYNKPYDYRGHITSYDWDAPINQQGSPTNKFFAFRQLAKKYATWQIPEVPQSIKTITIDHFIPSGFADLFQNLPQPTFSQINQLIKFEDPRLKMFKQGFVIYQTNLGAGTYQITLTVHDFALIYLNGIFLAQIDRGQNVTHTIKFQASHFVNRLYILVEAMGHINYGPQMLTDYKGLIDFKANFTPHEQKQEQQLKSDDFSWTIYAIPINNDILNWKTKSTKDSFPRLYRYNLTLEETGDTYLNMQNWKKGYIFVNGYNLGRYWNKGPQQKLYLPGVWLKKGVNDVVIFDLMMSSARFIKGDTTLK